MNEMWLTKNLVRVLCPCHTFSNNIAVAHQSPWVNINKEDKYLLPFLVNMEAKFTRRWKSANAHCKAGRLSMNFYFIEAKYFDLWNWSAKRPCWFQPASSWSVSLVSCDLVWNLTSPLGRHRTSVTSAPAAYTVSKISFELFFLSSSASPGSSTLIVISFALLFSFRISSGVACLLALSEAWLLAATAA